MFIECKYALRWALQQPNSLEETRATEELAEVHRMKQVITTVDRYTARHNCTTDDDDDKTTNVKWLYTVLYFFLRREKMRKFSGNHRD